MDGREQSAPFSDEAAQLRAHSNLAFVRAVVKHPWVHLLCSITVLSLIARLDSHFGYLTGVRLLYILPIWIWTRLGGVWLGILGTLVITTMMGMVDRSLLGMSADTAVQNSITRFLSLAMITLFIARHERVLNDARVRATRDPLTGVLNRSEIQARVELAIENERFRRPGLAFALVDCDRFKGVNDLHGHAFGDQVLRMLAAGLQTAVLKQGVVGRLSGDKFVVLFRGLPEGMARIRMEHAGRNFVEQMQGMGCDASMSFVLVPTNLEPRSFRGLLEAADSRMYARIRVPARVPVPAVRAPVR